LPLLFAILLDAVEILLLTRDLRRLLTHPHRLVSSPTQRNRPNCAFE
jgi:hypothetical protein